MKLRAKRAIPVDSESGSVFRHFKLFLRLSILQSPI